MPHVVIVGGGIIGLCTAYYLLSAPDAPRVTVVENTGIAAAASSKAAGFVAGGEGWHQPGNKGLARLSFEAYVDLDKELQGHKTYGWRRVTTTGVKVGDADSMSAYRQLPVAGELPKPANGRQPWANGTHSALFSDNCGQLLPDKFCERIHEECTVKGLVTVYATPTGRRGRTLLTTTGPIDFDRLVLAAGPWTADLCATLSLPVVPVETLPGHHIQIRPVIPMGVDSIPDEALFCGINDGPGEAKDIVNSQLTAAIPDYEPGSWERTSGWTRTVEFFPRADGFVYAAGENAVPKSVGDAAADARVNRLPVTAAGCPAHVDEELVTRMVRAAKAVSPALDIEKGAELVHADLCYRPVTADKMPLVGEWAKDVFVCAGHGPWGITLAPGTGIVMSELILADLARNSPSLSADISCLDPHRFTPPKATPKL